MATRYDPTPFDNADSSFPSLPQMPFSLRCLLLLVLTLTLSTASLFAAQPKDFRNLPAGASPKEVGKRVAERFASTAKLN